MLIAQQDTAVAAYHERVPQFLGTQADRIEAYVRGVGSATIGEIARALKMEKSTVSGRQNELRADKRLMFGPERKCKVSGVTCKTLVAYEPQQGFLV